MSQPSDTDLISVGDRAWIVGRGWKEIVSIAVALRPSVDPAAEEFYATVEAVERGVPHVLTFGDDSWAYGVQIGAVESVVAV